MVKHSRAALAVSVGTRDSTFLEVSGNSPESKALGSAAALPRAGCGDEMRLAGCTGC
jgi:hypothetical protein